MTTAYAVCLALAAAGVAFMLATGTFFSRSEGLKPALLVVALALVALVLSFDFSGWAQTISFAVALIVFLLSVFVALATWSAGKDS